MRYEMKRSMTLLLVLVMAVMFSGCGMMGTTKTTRVESTDDEGKKVTTTTTEPGPILGASDYDTHGKMYEKFVDSKAKMVKAVVDTPLTAVSSEAKGYEAGMKYMAVSEIARQQFGVAAPTTFMGVLNSAVGVVPAVMTVKGFTDIGKALVKTPRNINIENSNLTDSLNTTEQTQMSFGDGDPSIQGIQPATPPVIVEPSYPPVEAAPVL